MLIPKLHKFFRLHCTKFVIHSWQSTKIFVVYGYFLKEYQLSIFLYLLFAEKINFSLVIQQKISKIKLVLKELEKKVKRNSLKKSEIRKFWCFGVLDATNELHFLLYGQNGTLYVEMILHFFFLPIEIEFRNQVCKSSLSIGQNKSTPKCGWPSMTFSSSMYKKKW